MAKATVLISLLTDAETKETAYRSTLLQTLFEKTTIAPEFIGHYEPINTPVNDVSEALPYSDTDFFWRRKHRVVSQGAFFHSTEYVAGSIALDASFDVTVDWLSAFRQLVTVAKAYYGYLHLVTDEEWEKTRLSQEDSSTFRSGAFAKKLENGLMELGWANYFGSRWKSDIHPIKLAEKCSSVERAEDGLLFTVTTDISDVKINYDEFERRRKKIRAAFPEGFFRPSAR